MRGFLMRAFALAVLGLAIGGCTVRCEVAPMFADSLAKMFFTDDEPKMSSKGKRK